MVRTKNYTEFEVLITRSSALAEDLPPKCQLTTGLVGAFILTLGSFQGEPIMKFKPALDSDRTLCLSKGVLKRGKKMLAYLNQVHMQYRAGSRWKFTTDEGKFQPKQTKHLFLIDSSEEDAFKDAKRAFTMRKLNEWLLVPDWAKCVHGTEQAQMQSKS